MNALRPDLRVILVRPRNPLNIGAAARAMANFGFSDLAVVDPYPPVWRNTVSAVGAEAIVKNARVAETLEEAAADCELVLGTTAVRGRNLDRPVVRLPDIETFLGKYKAKAPLRVALVFGPEKTGLTEKYLEACNAYVTIPTSKEQPSLNLSHSVALCCYQLSQMAAPGKKPLGAPNRDVDLVTAEERERLVKQALQVFDAAGFLSYEPLALKTRRVRRTFLQWNLRSTDVRLLHGIFRFLLRRLKGN